MQIIRPTLVLDKEKALRNIERMAQKASANRSVFRPHFKTHQSLEVGEWFRAAGVKKITVSSLSMAEYFSDAWDDILVAFPVNILEIELINRLAAKIKLSLLVENTEVVDFLGKNLKHSVNIYIKTDVGYNRTGIYYENLDEILVLSKKIEQSGKLNFIGLLSHAGNSYHAQSNAEIIEIGRQSIARLSRLKQFFEQKIIVSYGDTPTLSLLPDWENIDEIRPGNFVFYDAMQWQLGACSFEEIAVALVAPVVAKHKERNEIVLYAGAIHLSKEKLNPNAAYGFIALWDGTKWGSPLESCYVKSLSQEHAVVKVSEKYWDLFSVGQLMSVIPVHSCLTVQNMRAYYAGNKFIHTF